MRMPAQQLAGGLDEADRAGNDPLDAEAELNAVARELNNRPRQTLKWMKPSEVFCRFVASTD